MQKLELKLRWQVKVCTVLAPRREDAGHSRPIRRVPDDGVSIRVEDQCPSAGAKNAIEFGQGGRQFAFAEVLVTWVETATSKSQGNGGCVASPT